METQEIRDRLGQAEMALVGLGEEFDATCMVRDVENFQKGRELLRGRSLNWLLPAWGRYCAGRLGMDGRPALRKLAGLLQGKDYFIVSVSVSDLIEEVFGSGRLVMPCGSIGRKQCQQGCRGELRPVSEEDASRMEELFGNLWEYASWPEEFRGLGNCGQCHSPMTLNNVYAAHYDESGYLEDWKRYTKWLQGTVNRSVFLLELGVSMGFPAVVRTPFERIAAYNRKAYLCRVNEKLCQIPDALLSKGVGISKNAIDWLSQL